MHVRDEETPSHQGWYNMAAVLKGGSLCFHKSPSGSVGLFGTWRFRENAPRAAEPPNMNEKQLKALRAMFSGGGPSSAMMVATLSEWYDAKHRRASPEEVAFINSLPAESCPCCRSTGLGRDGFAKKTGLLIRECKTCGRKFNPPPGRYSTPERYRSRNGSSSSSACCPSLFFVGQTSD